MILSEVPQDRWLLGIFAWRLGYIRQDRMLEQAYEVGSRKFGSDHVSTLLARDSLAKAYLVAGRVQEAVDLLEQVAQYRKAKLGADHPETLKTLANLASAYARAGREEDALELNVQVWERAEQRLGEDHPNTLTYPDRKQWEKAEPLALQVQNLIDRFDEVPPHFRWIVLRCSERTMAMYQDWGKADEVAEWKQKLAHVTAAIEKARQR